MKSLPRRFPFGLTAALVLVAAAATGSSPSLDAIDALLHPAAAAAAVSPPAVAFTKLGTGTAAAVQSVLVSAAELRERIRWVPVHHGGEKVMTPDAASRLLLTKAAAQRAGLDQVGLNYQDVYGLINAETTWLPRTGIGKNGTHSYGLAQFEPATAKGLGLKNPNDPVDAVYAAALHMKHAAEWAADKLEALKLPPQVYAAKLREGVSVYYNLSWKGRRAWDGINTAQLPQATQRHIKNTAWGVQRALYLEEKLATEGGLSS